MSAHDRPPTDDALLAFDRGELPDDELAAVARWLDAHPDAEEKLRGLAAEGADYAVEALREPHRLGDEVTDLAHVAATVVRRVLGAPGEASTPSGPSVPEGLREYQLLRPLGRGAMG